MSGWIMLLAALARPERVAGLVGIAGAPDFTEELLWTRLTPAQRREINETRAGRAAVRLRPRRLSLYARADRGRQKASAARQPIPLDVPVRLLHGMRDESVPCQLSLRLAERLTSRDVAVTLLKDGDHRLSTPADLALLAQTLDALIEA